MWAREDFELLSRIEVVAGRHSGRAEAALREWIQAESIVIKMARAFNIGAPEPYEGYAGNLRSRERRKGAQRQSNRTEQHKLSHKSHRAPHRLGPERDLILRISSRRRRRRCSKPWSVGL